MTAFVRGKLVFIESAPNSTKFKAETHCSLINEMTRILVRNADRFVF